MSRPDRLAVSLVEAAFELHRRRLWLEVPGDAPFLLRVAEEEHPLVASILGQERSDYGLMLAHGQDAFAQIASCILDARDRPEDFEAVSYLSVTVQTLASISTEMRAVLTAAGFQARRESLAPCFFSKQPHRAPRNPNRSEMRLMLASLRGVLAACDAGDFRPISLDRRRKRVFEVAVEGEGRDVKALVRVVPWPGSTSARAAEGFPELRAIDRNPPRVDVTWLVAFALLPGAERVDGRSLGACIIAETGIRTVLATEMVASGEPRAVAARLAQLFEAGLPREIVFANADLHEALAADLAALDIRTTLDPDQEDLAELFETLMNGLEAIADETAKESGRLQSRPESLEDWKTADLALTASLNEEVASRRALTPRAIGRFFGSEEIGIEVLQELQRLQPIVSVMEWLHADYRATKKSATIIERRLKAATTTPLERTLLEARVRARLSIYRIDSTQPGATLDVEDIFDGKRFTLHDRALSGCEVEGLFLPLRITTLGEWDLLTLAGPPLTQFQIDPALRMLESLGVELSADGLRRSSHLVGRLWELVLDRAQHAPRLTNTDGDPLVWHTATFRIADPDALARALANRRDVESDESGCEWTWSRPGGPARGLGDNTILGRLESMGDRLVLEVNSAARLARARQWIDALPGVSFERASAREFMAPDRPVDDQLPTRPVKFDPAMLRAIEETQRRYLREWIDQPVPALGGISPRRACTSVEGRRRVERLVRTMPAMTYPGGSIEPPRDEILRELGITR